MDREVVFGQTLEAVRKKAREQGNVISQEDVREAFSSLALEEAQLVLIYDYLKKHGIGVGEPSDPNDYLDNKDKKYLAFYLQELALSDTVSEGEREAVTLSAMAGETEAKKKLITLYLPSVVDIAKLYTGQGVFLEDLIGEGNVALACAVEMLGALEQASEVQGMLARAVMDAMEAHIAENMQSGNIGKQAAERVNKVRDAAKELSDALLRKVTVGELAAESGFSAEEIQEALRLSARKIEEIEDERGNGKQRF